MKKIKKILIIMITIFCLTPNVFAKTSVAIGTDFGSGNNSSYGEATTVHYYAGLMNYTSLLQTQPTVTNVTNLASTFSNSGSNGMLFYLGHGSSDRIVWNYNGSNNSAYKVGITRTGSMTSNDGYSLISVSTWGLSNAKLAVYMGCQTGKNTNNNIAKTAYNSGSGAKATLGWKQSINDGDSDAWVARFYNALYNSYSIMNAISYANNYTGYSDLNSISDIRTYGTITATLNSNPSVPMLNENVITSFNIEQKKSISEKEITDYMKKYVQNFNISDYVIEHTINDINEIYNYNLIIDGIKTTIGYTVSIQNNNIKIINNMFGFESKISDLRKYVASRNIKDFNKDNAIEYALNKHAVTQPEMSVKLNKTYTRYNVEKGKIEFIVALDYYDSQLDVKSIFTETFEI